MWNTVSPRFGLRPDWCRAQDRDRTRWPIGLAVLFVMGLTGSIVLLSVSLTAGRVGFENTLADELLARPLIEQFVLVALFAPVVEEFLFRLPLTQRLRIKMLAAVGVVGFLNFLPSDGAALTLVVAALFGTLALACGVLQTKRVWADAAARWWEAHPRWPVWASVTAFGLVHLSNYDVSWSAATVVVAPLVVSPQMWLGVMFTIACVRYGWWAGLVLHAMHNLAVWGFSSLLTEM